ncbi:hypothetical protein D8674_030602 [Pyrus ussuriensis x Pyrus communis]|uniref:Uncharacterized protein n=1 Tax=Pyrus ussuriensis x Pyrus communis TaxID=2448454 RepID=A0A5N5F1K4_9ROSA|nr:hypothetical protein D8674_030602 [Pyrus ussuriensis x Pyrus communis]
MLANGCSADLTDEYCRLAESIAIENLKRFCKAIEGIYGATYLRNPNREDLKRLLRKAEKTGFPSMIRSLDCMHWDQPSCSRLWRLTTHRFGMLSSALLDQTTISTFFGILLYSITLSMDGHQNFEDSDEDVDDDQPTHAIAIARDVEYLAPTTYETRQDRVTLSEYMRRLNRIQAPQCHDTLRKDLVEHVWP